MTCDAGHGCPDATKAGLHSGYIVKLIAPLIEPVWLGENFTPNVQLSPGENSGDNPHGCDPAPPSSKKSPLTVKGISDIADSPTRLLETTTIWLALVVPTAWGENTNLGGVKDRTATTFADSPIT
jgi:hypothetical protein